MIRDLFIVPKFNESRAEVSFTAPDDVRFDRWTVRDTGGVVAEGACETVPGRPAAFKVELPGFKPWSVEQPHLYTLSLSGTQAGEPVEHTQRFGMTRIHVENRTVHFNNRPLFLRGHIRGREAHDHPNLMNAPIEEYYAKNIRMSKAYGFNFIRFHSRVPDEAFLNLADELGILIHVEIRKYYGHYQKERKAKNFDGDQTLVDEADWEAMILRLRNHPCILVYCMGNEINGPGKSERVRIISDLTRRLDPTRLFLDTCSRGEYDRDTVDLDVQHMSYFAPYGRHHDMFDDSIHLAIYGTVDERPMTVESGADPTAWRLRREVPIRRPILAHEVAHYIALRDPYRLEKKFQTHGTEQPWWIGEIKKMVEAKGLRDKFDHLLAASYHYQYIWLKQCLESVRKSPIIQGFHMLQLADTDRYENANGLLDCFDDPKAIGPERILPFNGPVAVVADLPRRSLHAGQEITIPVFVSNYPVSDPGRGELSFSLAEAAGGEVFAEGILPGVDLDRTGNFQVARIEVTLPDLDRPAHLEFSLCLTAPHLADPVRNGWDLWIFPNQPERISPTKATIALRDFRPERRYPQIEARHDLKATEHLLITDRFTPGLLAHLAAGKDALVLYRLPENRDRNAAREALYLPSTWDRFKAIIWDRGHNCGGFLRPHPMVEDFPNGGFIDWQFYDLIEDSDKVVLDDFPAPIQAIIEGVDKNTRDRFDVNRIGVPEFQYAYTMRTFAYLFELRVGPGRLVVAPMNFTGLERDEPAVCWMFESIVRHMGSDRFDPAVSMELDTLARYLEAKGKERRIKERMMTQYWQQDKDPLETKAYWAESEAWLREDPMGDRTGHWGSTPWLDPTRKHEDNIQ